MVNDMTVGKPLKVITAFAVPLFVGNIFQQVYNIVDTLVVGRFVGSDALAAVGTCGGAFNLLISLILGLSSGMAVVTAQYFGAKNNEMVRKTFISSTIVILAAGVLISVVGMLAAKPLLIAMGTPAEIMDDACIYLTIMFAGTLANCLYNGISSVLRALGDSVVPLLILIAASLMNVGLDILFVLSFNMGVAGVALATVLSQLVSALACIVYVFRKLPILRFKFSELKLNRNVAREIIRIGFPAALSSSGISISIMFMQRAVNGFGATVVAGYTIAIKAEQIGMCLAFAIGLAVGTFCGQNIGARKMDRVKSGIHTGYLMAIAYTVIAGGIIICFASQIAGFFTTDAEVISIAISYMRLVLFFSPVLGILFIYQNFLRSAGDVAPTVWMSVAEILSRSIFALLLAWIFGYIGVWWATPIAWTTSMLVGFVRYKSGKWKNKMLDVQSAE